jgi:glycosyltransferase involved in cell wall biosynthesis
MQAPNQTIRLTYLIGSLNIGGAETQLVRLINGLDRTRFRPSVICISGYGPLKEQLDDRVDLVSLQLPSVRRLSGLPTAGKEILGLGRCRTQLIRQRPDIVHGYMMSAYVLGALAAWSAGIGPVIASRRGLDTHSRHPSRRLRLAARIANRIIDFHLCNSDAVRQRAIADEGLPSSKTGVIYNGVDTPVDANRADLPDEWCATGNDGCVAMVANFRDVKRHADVLEAVRLMVGRRPRLKLVLFGDGPERGRIERLVHEGRLDQNVVLAGVRPEAAELLPAFDLTVLASSQESFPNALMESMACGVPVVATRVGGVPELVRDGVDGRLVEVGKPDQLAAAMLELLDKPQLRRQMGDAARARIRESFSFESMVTKTENLYTQLMSERRIHSRAVKPASLTRT